MKRYSFQKAYLLFCRDLVWRTILGPGRHDIVCNLVDRISELIFHSPAVSTRTQYNIAGTDFPVPNISMSSTVFLGFLCKIWILDITIQYVHTIYSYIPGYIRYFQLGQTRDLFNLKEVYNEILLWIVVVQN